MSIPSTFQDIVHDPGDEAEEAEEEVDEGSAVPVLGVRCDHGWSICRAPGTQMQRL